ncbi:type II toxin-antitoxin system prevent-host-death family antitoxin [Azospirillum sp.]|uniref:type II toxin-antitoxin system Phd/YefM family antitoxin n=1 Tax=Azospirillum sp. TaxID=34012 RepID=UPI002D4A747D|nr:type II toxin-antitoxin system prevent-host-death family antitoxin [Azospirillum sp.]HYD67048.1 type II toxin-antitoxin system prevent-host-death family antitoxin [Azospirillum sp.]
MTRMIPMSEFQDAFQRLVEEVTSTGESVIVTKDGKPVSQFSAITEKPNPKSLFGFMKGRMTVHGDLDEPIDVEWDALK